MRIPANVAFKGVTWNKSVQMGLLDWSEIKNASRDAGAVQGIIFPTKYYTLMVSFCQEDKTGDRNWHLSGKATSMIGLCQEGKSSPDALRRSAGVNLLAASARVLASRPWFLFENRTRLPLAVSKISEWSWSEDGVGVLLPVSKLINGSIGSLRSRAQSA